MVMPGKYDSGGYYALHVRYADRLNPSGLNPAYAEQTKLLRYTLKRRGVDPDAVVDAPSVVPRSSCRLRPLADHVVVLPDAAETVSQGGILIPETAKETPMQGAVLAVGPGRTEPGIGTVLPAVSIGDVVLFGRYSGLKIDLDGQALLIMREEDVLGVLTPKVGE